VGTIVAPESMMRSLHVISLALQVALPILLLGWIVRGKSASISGWLARAATAFPINDFPQQRCASQCPVTRGV
jgi:hypothetical protein